MAAIGVWWRGVNETRIWTLRVLTVEESQQRHHDALVAFPAVSVNEKSSDEGLLVDKRGLSDQTCPYPSPPPGCVPRIASVPEALGGRLCSTTSVFRRGLSTLSVCQLHPS